MRKAKNKLHTTQAVTLLSHTSRTDDSLCIDWSSFFNINQDAIVSLVCVLSDLIGLLVILLVKDCDKIYISI